MRNYSTSRPSRDRGKGLDRGDFDGEKKKKWHRVTQKPKDDFVAIKSVVHSLASVQPRACPWRAFDVFSMYVYLCTRYTQQTRSPRAAYKGEGQKGLNTALIMDTGWFTKKGRSLGRVGFWNAYQRGKEMVQLRLYIYRKKKKENGPLVCY